MTFGNPAWLAVLAALPLILAMHLRHRPSVRVSSVLLWSRLQKQASGNRSRGRLQFSWPLLLQLLVVIALALALARPQLESSVPPAHPVFVIDTSASMLAEEGGRTRFEEARDLLSAELERLLRAGSAERVSVVATAPARFVALDVEAIALADQAVERLEPAAEVSDWPSVEELLKKAFAGDFPDLLVIGDEEPGWALKEFEFRSVRGSGMNLALSGVSVSNVDGDTWRVSGSVQRYAGPVPGESSAAAPSGPAPSAAKDADEQLTIDFRPEGSFRSLRWNEVPLEFNDSGRAGFDVELELPGSGALKVSLPGDGFELDDAHHALVHPQGATFAVLAVGDVDESLIEALAMWPGARVTTAAQLPEESGEYDLVIVGDGAVDRHPGTSTLWIGSRDEGTSIVRGPEVVRQDETHPLTKQLDLTALRIAEATRSERVPGAVPLLSAGGFPLLQVRYSALGIDVFLAFEPGQSNWTELASFPVFVAALVELVAPHGGKAIDAGCRAGDSCRLDPRVVAGEWPLVDPTGEEKEFPPGLEWLPMAAMESRVLDRPGFYRIGTRFVPVNFDSPTESSAFGALEVSNAPGPAGQPLLETILFALAFLLLLFELLVSIRQRHLAVRTGGGGLTRQVLLQFLLRGVTLVLVAQAALQVPLARPVRPAQQVLLLESGRHLVGPAIEASEELLASANENGWLVVDGGDSPVAAVDHALALVPGYRVNPEVVVATSGAVEPQDLANTVDSASDAGARINLFPIPIEQPGEVLVSTAGSPDNVEVLRPFELAFTLHSVGSSLARYRLLRNGDAVSEGEMRLSDGYNRLEFERTEEDVGSYRFELEIQSRGDRVTANNRSGTIVNVREGPQIAIFAAEQTAGEDLGAALEVHGIEAELLSTNQFPYYLGDESTPLRAWLDYDLVVLMNVPALELSSVQQEQLSAWVREYGRGLLVLGGPNTFGPGGYYGTRLEELLPLSTQVPQEKAAVAIVFVIDRSGSMRQLVDGQTRLEIAKTATREAIGLLDEESLVGAVAFDADAHTVVPLQNPTNSSGISDALAQLTPGGGTSIYPGLERAFAELSTADPEMSRHIVLMTDGLSQPGEFEALVGQIRSAGITVSTAAIGEGADASLVQDIARWGGGSSHVTRDFQALPSILAQEALLLSDDPVQQVSFQPEVGIPGEITRNSSLPTLQGYVMTTERPEATVQLYAPDGAPLLASWRYGLGRVAAFTSQGAGPWVEDWMALESYPRLWAQLVRWLTPTGTSPSVEPDLSVRRVADNLQLTVSAPDDSQMVVVTGPDGESVEVDLERDSEGRLKASVPTWASGEYRVSLSASEESGDPESVLRSVMVSYPDEFDFSDSGFEGPLWLAAVTGGSVLSDLPGRSEAELIWLPITGWRVWGLLAALLFLVELAMRYLLRQRSIRRSRGLRGGAPGSSSRAGTAG